ncbi:2OG-Fe(II) oxygenase [Nocardia sp. NPDC047038]|uniref:2OG-Fe(II) oxygenase n=1 Tax=Nocardia sp. NPDC047038 TaxID=3154338 RepID=UPI0034027D6F
MGTEWSIPSEGPFHWHTYDVESNLPGGWNTELLALAARQGVEHTFRPSVSTAREAAEVEIPLESVSGETLFRQANWVYQLYGSWFRMLAERYAGESLSLTSTPNRALSLNVLRGNGERYPCHVDSNPTQGLLYLTDCTEETGGGLAIARNRTARNVAEVDSDCLVLYPRRGLLLFFDARYYAHYVRPMRHESGLRVVLTMNYYSKSCPESVRPADLDAQLFR